MGGSSVRSFVGRLVVWLTDLIVPSSPKESGINELHFI